MKKQLVLGIVIGGVLFGTAGVFAGQWVATENPFHVQLNGEEVTIQGYNIEGNTYFKLRDIADIVGGFDVGFNNDTIQLAKDGYVYGDITYYQSNQYGGLEYIDITGRTIYDVAAEADIPYQEFLEIYHLPSDLPEDTNESMAYNLIPFGIIIEMNQYENFSTVEEAKELLELPDWVNYDTPWGEAIAQSPLRAYVGEENLDQFKAIYGLDDAVNGDTLFGEIKRIVDEKDRESRIAEEGE